LDANRHLDRRKSRLPRPPGRDRGGSKQPSKTRLARAKLTKRRLKRGVFKSIVDLQAAINRFLAETNDDPRPFTWTADPDQIIAAVRRGHHALNSIR
jgi:hypothetical protein